MAGTRVNAAKWSRNAQNAVSDYQDGVQNPNVNWDVATANAAPLWEAGIQKAVQNKTFAKGVKAAGHAKWQANTLAKGPARFSQGVMSSQDNYTNGFTPYAKVIDQTQLPARGPKGSPQNYQRSQAIGTALNAAKVKFQGGTS